MIASNRTRHSLCYAAIAVGMFLIAAPAVLADPHAYQSAEFRACAVDMDLNPSTADYDVCVKSLDRALSEARSGHYAAMTNERRACADIGIDPSGRAFDRCVTDLRGSLWNEDNLGAR